VVAINHTCDSVEDLIYLIKYDSTHGRFSVDDKLPIHAADDNILIVGENAIHLSSERDIGRLDWTQSSTEYVLECTGKFTKLADASRHITDAGAKRVVISAPSKDAPTFVCGVNTHKFREAPGDTNEVVSNASCTTNCAAPLVSVLNEAFTIEEAFLTTVHSTTQSQKILDSYSRKGKRAGSEFSFFPKSTTWKSILINSLHL
jgi:glyceraldehyde 3-phosphate dehydrogenase